MFKDIQTHKTSGCGIKQGKLYYLDLTSDNSIRLTQPLFVDGSLREKDKESGCGIVVLFMPHLAI